MKSVLYRRKIFMRVIFLCEWVPVPRGAGFLISSGNNYFPLRRKFSRKQASAQQDNA